MYQARLDNKLAPAVLIGQTVQYRHQKIDMAGIVSKIEDEQSGLICLHVCIPPGPGPFVGLGPVVTLQHIPYDPAGGHRSWHFLDEAVQANGGPHD
jgi:hypothetical protein